MNKDIELFMDRKTYNAEMAKSAYDKLAFVNRLFTPIELIVDFGCADGAITQMMRIYYPNAEIIGYDLPGVLETNGLGNDHVDEFGIKYCSDLDRIKDKVMNQKSLLIMNSATHELYNYMNSIEREQLFKTLFTMGFNYIWNRDMIIKVYPTKTPKYVQEVTGNALKYLERKGYGDQMLDFAREYGALTAAGLNDDVQLREVENLTHFLLKCRYKANWKRELVEDYTLFGQNMNKFEEMLRAFGYIGAAPDGRSTTEYVLPYTRYINDKDFDIDLEKIGVRTHCYMIFKKSGIR